MRYGSLFSGVGGFDLGFERAGLECAWQVEIDANCRDVLARHWPDVPRFVDVKQVGRGNLEPVDLICGGFPCQDLSVAGRRAGLAGERSGLWFEFRRILAELGPEWVVVENVPGLLSSNGGRDFAVLLRGLVELGYGVCWRVLDSQYFGVAQRRRRVFIVGSLGDGRAAEVLFEREGGAGDSPPRRKAGAGFAEISGTLSANAGGPDFCIVVPDREADAGRDVRRISGANRLTAFGGNNTAGPIDVATGLNAKGAAGRRDFESETFVVSTLNSDGAGGGFRTEPGEHIAAFDAIAWHENKQGELSLGDTAKALRSGASHSYQGIGIRRLTPVECERLQGFPDGWTDGQSDSVRYRQLGNAVTVNVAEWIGRRIVAAASNDV